MAKKSFKIRGNLAEALDDTVQSAKNNAGELHVEIIPLRKIELDPYNPRDLMLSFEDARNGFAKDTVSYCRKAAEKDALASLAKSIKEQGIINPIVVYKHGDFYRLIAGERRTLASLLIKKQDIPAKILTTRPDQLKLSLIQWIENIEREDLSLWERMRNLEKIIAAYASAHGKQISDVTPTDVSNLIGCSLQQGVNYRHLLNSPEALKENIKSGDIKNIEKAAFISKSPKELHATLIEACLTGTTLSELKKLARENSGTISVDSSMKNAKLPTKVNFGSTTSTKVAKTIINTILEHEDFQHLHTKLGNVQWGSHKSITNAFRHLIKLLEQA